MLETGPLLRELPLFMPSAAHLANSAKATTMVRLSAGGVETPIGATASVTAPLLRCPLRCRQNAIHDCPREPLS